MFADLLSQRTKNIIPDIIHPVKSFLNFSFHFIEFLRN